MLIGVLLRLCRTDLVVRIDRWHDRAHIASLSCSTGTDWLRLHYVLAGTTKEKKYVLCMFSVLSVPVIMCT